MLENGKDMNEKINLRFLNNFRERYRPIHTDAVSRVCKVYKVFKAMALLLLRLSLEAILNNVTLRLFFFGIKSSNYGMPTQKR